MAGIYGQRRRGEGAGGEERERGERWELWREGNEERNSGKRERKRNWGIVERRKEMGIYRKEEEEKVENSSKRERRRLNDGKNEKEALEKEEHILRNKERKRENGRAC